MSNPLHPTTDAEVEFEAILGDATRNGQREPDPASNRPRKIPYKDGLYARITLFEMSALVRSMPDTQSAVLACLQWQAALQARLTRGPLAGQRVARLSAATIGTLTGRSVRTVRGALARLKQAALIAPIATSPGRTMTYRLTFEQAWDKEDAVDGPDK